MNIRTRFAPSPTGMIHIGNLRTALFSYLIARHNKGKFILRIEDTDQTRSKKEYEEYIFKALKDLGLEYDEGPDKGGEYGPYRQSERKEIYLKYAQQLIDQGSAYYCFCPECKSDSDHYKEENNEHFIGYNGHCRNLSEEEINENLALKKPYVIRQRIPENVEITYFDTVYGKIKFNTNDLDDQVLIKSDGFPTYNFANVIDDHLMKITHVVRGNEYISSTPKYLLLYQAFGWTCPEFVHLPVIFIKDENGEERKLSKRDNCSSFEQLINTGYLKEAIINYIMFQGWNPKFEHTFFNMNEFIDLFEIYQIHNTSKTIFSPQNLDFFNRHYMQELSDEEYKKYCQKFTNYNSDFPWDKVIPLLKPAIYKFSEVYINTYYIFNPNTYTKDLFFNYIKAEIKEQYVLDFINYLIHTLNSIDKNDLATNEYYNMIKEYSKSVNLSFGIFMHLFRVFMSGLKDVMITGIDIANIIGKQEVIKRIFIAQQILLNKN